MTFTQRVVSVSSQNHQLYLLKWGEGKTQTLLHLYCELYVRRDAFATTIADDYKEEFIIVNNAKGQGCPNPNNFSTKKAKCMRSLPSV